jgi:hypothetical protein
MAIKSIYGKYLQKSKVFLYPLLGIKRGSKIVPSETYLAWESFYKTEDIKLICLYHPKEKNDYESFEKKVLLKHNRLVDIKNINENDKLFIFDFLDIEDDWKHVINGKYSKINPKLKGNIKSFFDVNSANYSYMNSYLYPNKYFEEYAECLGVNQDLLETVGELCAKPDIEKETFKVKQLEKKEIIN